MNSTMFNCCTDNSPPDWSQFDGFEINCCATEDGFTNTVPLSEAEFFTVYGHLRIGGVEAITDVSTRKLAHSVAQKLCDISGMSRDRIQDFCRDDDQRLEARVHKATTHDLGILIRDCIEDREFKIYGEDASGDIVEAADDEVICVDMSDPSNLLVQTLDGQCFRVRIFAA